jgi:acetamidase/formamidase
MYSRVTAAAYVAMAVALMQSSHLMQPIEAADHQGTHPRASTGMPHIGARPETTVWGEIPIGRPPVATIRSGDTVTIDTISHQGSTQDANPVDFLTGLGAKREEILQDVLDFWASRGSRPREGRGAHVLTGPIYVDGAAPGDTLEIQILDFTLRTPFGLNSTTPTTGVLAPTYPGTKPGDPPPVGGTRLIRTGLRNGRPVAVLSADVVIPLRPFMGTLAVAPESGRSGQPGIAPDGAQSSRPPGSYGGNLDFRELSVGASLFLPVFQPGAQFYVGDPHSVQGDGEVNGTALEHSLTGRFRFVVHKGRRIDQPRIETPTHYIVTGIDLDLDRAMRLATQQAVDFLTHEKGLSAADAYALASLACDFHVAEAVDLTQVVVGKIPKDVFLKK